MALTLVGLAIGLVLAAIAYRSMTALLYAFLLGSTRGAQTLWRQSFRAGRPGDRCAVIPHTGSHTSRRVALECIEKMRFWLPGIAPSMRSARWRSSSSPKRPRPHTNPRSTR
jgi:hypothetical protein